MLYAFVGIFVEFIIGYNKFWIVKQLAQVPQIIHCYNIPDPCNFKIELITLLI